MLFLMSYELYCLAYLVFGAASIFSLPSLVVVVDMKIARTGYTNGRVICSVAILSSEERSHA